MRAAAATGSRDETPAEYAGYLAQLRRRVQELVRYPLAARRRGLSGTVHVELVISQTGAVNRVSVVRSSAHPLLDDAAVESIRALPPTPFPAGVPPRQLVVRLPVVFELD
jgi:protein TonB